MKRLPLIFTLVAMGTVLAACGKKPAEPMADGAPAATTAPAPGDAMAGADGRPPLKATQAI